MIKSKKNKKIIILGLFRTKLVLPSQAGSISQVLNSTTCYCLHNFDLPNHECGLKASQDSIQWSKYLKYVKPRMKIEF